MNKTASPSKAYALTSELEILGILKDLRRNQQLVHVQTPTGASMLSTLMEIDHKNHTLIFDGTADTSLLRSLLSPAHLHFDASNSGVHISFHTGPATEYSLNGHPALSLPFPTELTRIQRRDTFRIETPASTPVLCVVNHPDGPATLPLIDISTGGLGVFDNTHLIMDPVGTLYNESRLNLPNVGPLVVNLRLVHVLEYEKADKPLRSLGFSFHKLSPATGMQIQRYITTLERAMLARSRGYS